MAKISPSRFHRLDDVHKRPHGSKLPATVETLRHLFTVSVTAANREDRALMCQLSAAVQQATDQNIKVAYLDQGYTGKGAGEQAADGGIELKVVKLGEAERGFVLLPKRWLFERSFGWCPRFRHLGRDYKRTAQTLEGMHRIAFVVLLLRQALTLELL